MTDAKYESRTFATDKAAYRRTTLRSYFRRFARFAVPVIVVLGGSIFLARLWGALPDGSRSSPTVAESLSTGLTVAGFALVLFAIGFAFVVWWVTRALNHPSYAFFYAPRRVWFDESGVEETFDNGIRDYVPWSEIQYAYRLEGSTYLIFAGQNAIIVPDDVFEPEAEIRFRERVAALPTFRKT